MTLEQVGDTMPRTTVLAEKLFLILDDNKFHPYYICRLQRLVERDCMLRKAFSQWLIHISITMLNNFN